MNELLGVGRVSTGVPVTQFYSLAKYLYDQARQSRGSVFIKSINGKTGLRTLVLANIMDDVVEGKPRRYVLFKDNELVLAARRLDFNSFMDLLNFRVLSRCELVRPRERVGPRNRVTIMDLGRVRSFLGSVRTVVTAGDVDRLVFGDEDSYRARGFYALSLLSSVSNGAVLQFRLRHPARGYSIYVWASSLFVSSLCRGVGRGAGGLPFPLPLGGPC